MPDTQPELMSCPFCGAKANEIGPVLYVNEDGLRSVLCENCIGEGPIVDHDNDDEAERQAITAWNTRPNTARLDTAGLAGELERDLEEIQWQDRPLPWVVHSGCSYRRIASEPTRENCRSFPDGNVLHAIRHKDGCLDLSMSEDQLNALVRIINAVPRILTALRQAPAPADGVLNDIAAMMSEFVDNWPQPKKVNTALKLIAKTIRTLLNPPKHDYWGAGEPDCPREIKAGNGELHTLRCKVCGEDNPRDNRCFNRAALSSTPAPEAVELQEASDDLQMAAERAGCVAAEAMQQKQAWAHRWGRALQDASGAMFMAVGSIDTFLSRQQEKG